MVIFKSLFLLDKYISLSFAASNKELKYLPVEKYDIIVVNAKTIVNIVDMEPKAIEINSLFSILALKKYITDETKYKEKITAQSIYIYGTVFLIFLFKSIEFVFDMDSFIKLIFSTSLIHALLV